MKKQNIQKLVLFITWIAVIASAVYFYLMLDIPLKEYPMKIREVIDTYGAAAPIIYIVLYTIRPLIFFPATLMTIIAGALFGPVLGVIYTIIGANLSANFAFIVGRYFGQQFISNSKKGFITKIDTKAKDNGFITVLLMRLLYFPFDLTNYICGMTSIKQSEYALATLLGTATGSITFVLIGASFADPRNLLISGALFVISLLVSKKLQKKHKDFAQVKDASM